MCRRENRKYASSYTTVVRIASIFFWSQTGLVLRPTVSDHITGIQQETAFVPRGCIKLTGLTVVPVQVRTHDITVAETIYSFYTRISVARERHVFVDSATGDAGSAAGRARDLLR